MGYDSQFLLGCVIPLPELTDPVRASAFNEGQPVGHTRFSLVFNEERGLAAVTAHNIDGASLIPEGVVPYRRQFRFDPEVPSGLQIDNDRGYRNNPYDRGHLVRRRALHWGDESTARRADNESFFWTNIAPQHENLNQTAWARIEDWMLELADRAEQRASVFTGPVFTVYDPPLQNQPDEEPILIPGGFWKIISIKHGGQLRAAAFLTWQRDFGSTDPVQFDPVLEQVRITTIEYLTGLNFVALRDADPLRFGEELEEVPRRSAVVTCKEDVMM